MDLTRTLAPIFVLMAALLAACATEHPDLAKPSLAAGLPRTVGGIPIVYYRTEGPELALQMPDALPLRVADALEIPRQRIAYITGYRDDRATYNSDIIQIQGANTDELLEAVISHSAYTGARRVDSIAGKSVVRAATPNWMGSMDETPYFYAFGDVVIIIIGERQFVEEGLRSLP